MGRIKVWKQPNTPREIMAFIGIAIFYMRWILFFEIKITRLRELVKEFELDHKLTATQFTKEHIKEYKDIKDRLLSKPILQRANPRKRFYLKTDFSAKGMGFALCQPGDNKELLEEIKREMDGGE
eukprot:2433614-Ditylum_brightwellii.AAC.2